jgi:hypothetical protein
MLQEGGVLMRKAAFSWVFALLAALVVAAPAVGQEGSRQEYRSEFTTTQPGAPTGWRQWIRYVNPGDPNGKPYAVAEIVFQLPEGTRIDTSVPPQCKASDGELQMQGAAACPPETKVGVGTLTADTGSPAGPLPRVVETNVTFFNNQDQIILFAETTNFPGPQPVRIASRVEVQGSTTISRVPPIPAAPPPEPFLALKDVFNELNVITVGSGSSRRAYITTPPTCPPSGKWTFTTTFTYRDGVKQPVQSDTPCTPGAAPSCQRASSMEFKLHRSGSNRVVQVDAFVDGKRHLRRTGRDIARVTLKGLKRDGTMTVRIVATHNTGSKVVSTRTWTGCVKGKPRVLRVARR